GLCRFVRSVNGGSCCENGSLWFVVAETSISPSWLRFFGSRSSPLFFGANFLEVRRVMCTE
ncbi:hypothetical protein LINGRAHAP2_LOCUS25568, partial [Linum grandiflorum]